MNYFIDALIQMQINKLNELKNQGATDISINTVIKLLLNMQKINKGEDPDPKFDLQNDEKQ